MFSVEWWKMIAACAVAGLACGYVGSLARDAFTSKPEPMRDGEIHRDSYIGGVFVIKVPGGMLIMRGADATENSNDAAYFISQDGKPQTLGHGTTIIQPEQPK